MSYKTRLVNDKRITKLLLLCKYYYKRELQISECIPTRSECLLFEQFNWVNKLDVA